MRLNSIRWKAALLLVIVAMAPVVAAVLLLLRVNSEAVRTSEKSLQAAVLSEIGTSIVARIESAQSDAQAVAAVLAIAAAAPPSSQGDGFDDVRAVLASRPSISAVRFEVPKVKLSTVIRGKSAAASDIAASTEAQQKLADDRGAAFTVTGPGRGSVVVPIPRVRGAKEDAPHGYVTAGVDLTSIGAAAHDVIDQRFSGEGASLVVLDADARVVASAGSSKLAPGEQASSLPVLSALPQGVPWTTRISVVSQHVDAGVSMVGAADSLPELGWAIALWRPEAVAYKTLGEMRAAGQRVALLTALAAMVIGLIAGRSITSPVIELVEQAKLIGQRKWSDVRIRWMGRDEIGMLARSLQSMSTDLQQSEVEIANQAKLRGDLSRFLSKELVTEIVEGRHKLSLGGERSMVSVLFADVVAFTPLAETRPPEEVVALLNELFSMLSEIVFRHGGTVDKFIGDCLMGVWGAPVKTPDHALHALSAAEDMLRFLEGANEEWKKKYGVEVRLAVGVNSGDAIVGNIGSDKRMEYTVIGDVVNIAARLESIAAPNQILVGELTAELMAEDFTLRLMGEQKLTGRQTMIKVFELQTT